MLLEANHKLPLEGGVVRHTLVLLRSKLFSLAFEAKGRPSLRGMLEVSSLRACLKACKAGKAWTLPGVQRGEGLKGGLSALCNANQNAACCM